MHSEHWLQVCCEPVTSPFSSRFTLPKMSGILHAFFNNDNMIIKICRHLSTLSESPTIFNFEYVFDRYLLKNISVSVSIWFQVSGNVNLIIAVVCAYSTQGSKYKGAKGDSPPNCTKLPLWKVFVNGKIYTSKTPIPSVTYWAQWLYSDYTVTTQWLDSDCVVTVDYCQQHSDYTVD